MTSGKSEPLVFGPDGKVLTLSDLPAHEDDERWTPRRKAIVVAAVEGGLLSRDVAIKLYQLTSEELESWCEAYARSGLEGLKVTSKSQRSTKPPSGS